MKRSNKKGFTIVELVIVIAIIAILAAVLIPTFASLIQKANVSADTQLIKNLNTALVTEKAGGENCKTMHEAIQLVRNAGYDVDKIVSKSGNNIVWDSVNDRFVLVKTDDTFIYPTDNGTTEQKIPENEKVNYFMIYNKMPALDEQKYSIYLSYNAKTAAGKRLTVVDAKVGVDVGDHPNVTTVNYTNSSANQNVIIRVAEKYNNKLNITDNGNGTQRFYGHVATANVSTGSDCLYVHGKVDSLNLNAGKVVVDKNGIAMVSKTVPGTVVVGQNGGFVLVADGASIADNTVNASAGSAIGSAFFGGGSGTEADPWLIDNEKQLISKDADRLSMRTVGGYFKLNKNIVVSEEIYLSGKVWVFDLNGHSVTLKYAKGVSPNNGGVFNIAGKNSHLTINDSSNGKGEVIGSNEEYDNKVICAVRVGNYGKLTINGGHFYGKSNATSCIFVCTSTSTSTKATVVINGGTFETASPSNGTYFVLNHEDGSKWMGSAGCTMTVNGGTFKNYNPSVTVVDTDHANTGKISLGNGCTTTSTKDESGNTWYTVSKSN